MSDSGKLHCDAEMKGWLSKWTNYIKGYQRRWFVLSNGLLSYYRNQAEMAHTCRGTMSLHGALIHTEDSCTFVISNGGTQTFHIKAASEVERQRWVTALELAKAKAIRAMESEDEDEDYDATQKCEITNVLKSLSGRLEDLQTCNELITKHGTALQRALSELEALDSTQDLSAKIRAINERATLFRITSNAMINTCSEYLELAQTQGRKWQRVLQHERDQRVRLEEIVEQLARQHSILEQAAKEHQIPRPAGCSPSTDEDDESTEFYDAQSEDTLISTDTSTDFVLKIPSLSRRPSSPLNKPFQIMDSRSDEASGSSSDVDDTVEAQVVVFQSDPTAGGPPNKVYSAAQYRLEGGNDAIRTSCKLPPTESNIALARSVGKPGNRRCRVPDRPNCSLSLWSIMKNCIGKELSKIPMPVNFSEPLSMLQRLTEDYEYTNLLDHAASLTNTCEQLAYVAAFTVSSYSTTAYRTGKPFNPLLGETYECDRTSDLGWRCISEQVSHHPPMVAQYCEGKRWRCWQEFTMSSKFRGKYLQVNPLGTAHLEFPESGNHYTWRKVTTTVHNIIVGKLWVDQHGDMDIINHKDGSKCHLSYIPYSYFTRDTQRKVKGCVMDKDGQARWVVTGTWDGKIEIAPVTGQKGTKDNPIYQTGPYTVIWTRTEPPEDCAKYYHFTTFACQLNEMEEGVAPTDSRYRPDQRLMEEGRWDEANAVKLKLEEKQRAARRQRESSAEQAVSTGTPYAPYEPVWFKKEMDPITGSIAHIYKGGYWECKEKQDWSRCPSIFNI